MIQNTSNDFNPTFSLTTYETVVSFCQGTRAGPTSMDRPLPSMLAAWLMLVAVVLSSGGNQWLEMRGGAAMMVTPEIPLRIAQA